MEFIAAPARPSSPPRLEVGRCYAFRKKSLEPRVDGEEEEEEERSVKNLIRCGLVRDYSESDQAYLVELEGLTKLWIQTDTMQVVGLDRDGDGNEILPTPVIFEDCLGKHVKVWWEEDGCFYPGVVRDTREEEPERDDGAESNNAKSNASLGEEDKLVAGEKRPLQKAVKIVYPYDSVEEWIPFHSRNLYWIHHQIEVGIPQTCFSLQRQERRS
jgi:hypothetical protein